MITERKTEEKKDVIVILERKKREGQHYSIISTCKKCKNDFLAVRSSAKYCSDYCRLSFYRLRKRVLKRIEAKKYIAQKMEEIRNRKNGSV